MEILIITGMSGGGKSRAAAVLEDIGFYTVDNLPAEMMVHFAAFCRRAESKYSRLAFVYDIRADEPATALLEALATVRKQGRNCTVLYLDCDDDTIIHRYKETRRVHPLEGDGCTLPEALVRERELMAPICDQADIVWDTSSYSVAKLRSALLGEFGTAADRRGLEVHIMSFGFKHGLPQEADMVLDVRFLPNPYYVDDLKKRTGLEAPVQEFIYRAEETHTFLDKTADLLQFLLPRYEHEGKSLFVLAVGCTGGHHRSVAMCHALCQRVAALGYGVTEIRRDRSR